jgi:hypothetical protein
LVGAGASVTGSALRALTTTLTQADIEAIAAEVWSRTLPLDAAPIYAYGPTTLNSNDLDAIARSAWSRTLP